MIFKLAKRRSALLTAVFCVVFCLSFLGTAGIPFSGEVSGVVFTIILEEKGKSDESFEKKVEVGYRPCSIWNGRIGVGSPQMLLSQRGSIAGLKPEEVLQFYEAQKTGEGKESGGCSATVETVGDGQFRMVVKRGKDVKNYESGSPPGANRMVGPSANATAELERTRDGAILTITEPGIEAEGYCDFFSLFADNNEPAGLKEVLQFKLSNAELANWNNLRKTNERTLKGSESGTLQIKVTLVGGPAGKQI